MAPPTDRRRPFSAVAHASACVAVVGCWLAGVALLGSGGSASGFDGEWSAPLLRILAAGVAVVGAGLALSCAAECRRVGRISAARFSVAAAPVSLAGGAIALLPDRVELSVASFAMTGLVLTWGLWWWHEVRRTRYSLVGLVAAAYGAGMLWPGWAGASGRLLAALSFAGFLAMTTRDISRSVAADRLGDSVTSRDVTTAEAAVPVSSIGISDPTLTEP